MPNLDMTHDPPSLPARSSLLDHLEIRCRESRQYRVASGAESSWGHTQAAAHFLISGSGVITTRSGTTYRGHVGDLFIVFHADQCTGLRAVTGDANILSAVIHPISSGTSSVFALLPPMIHVVSQDQPNSLISSATIHLLSFVTLDQPGEAAIIHQLLSLIVLEVVRTQWSSSSAIPEHWQHGLDDVELGPVLAGMMLQPGDPWTVESLATSGHMSRSQFARRFRDVLGASPLDVLTSIRIRWACDLISAKVPQKEIAQQVGYGSVSAFCVAFRRQMNMTPTQYGKSLGFR